MITFSADEIFESVGDRELRQIFEGQNRIHLEIKQLNRQLDMILDEQRRYVSSLTEEIAKRGAGAPGQQGQVSWPGPRRCLGEGRSLGWRSGRKEAEAVWVLRAVLSEVGALGLPGHLVFFLQTFQQELDTVVNTQHEILRQVNEMK